MNARAGTGPPRVPSEQVMASVSRTPRTPLPTDRPGVVGGWESRISELRPRLVSVARRVVRDRHEAEDVADEVIGRLLALGPDADELRNVDAWLHRATLSLAIDRARSWVRRQKKLAELARREAASPAPPEDAVLGGERREAVWQALLDLPRRQQQVMVLREMEGLAYAEVAARLGLEESTTRAHAHAARETLRRKLRDWKEGR